MLEIIRDYKINLILLYMIPLPKMNIQIMIKLELIQKY